MLPGPHVQALADAIALRGLDSAESTARTLTWSGARPGSAVRSVVPQDLPWVDLTTFHCC